MLTEFKKFKVFISLIKSQLIDTQVTFNTLFTINSLIAGDNYSEVSSF